MSWSLRLVMLAIGLAMVGGTLELIRKRRLREQYGVLWICAGLVVLVLVVMPNIAGRLASWLGLDHGVLLMLVCFAFLAAIGLHYAVVTTKHGEREKELSQELAVLKDELMSLREEMRQQPPPAPEPRPRPPSLRT